MKYPSRNQSNVKFKTAQSQNKMIDEAIIK